MTQIRLISVEDCKDLSLINDNVDTKIIRYSIQAAQDQNIQQALGTPLYKELLRMQEEDDWKADYRELNEDYIHRALAAWVDVRIIQHLNNKITNKAVGKSDDENLTANTLAENNSYKQVLKRDAEFYTNRLIGYLKDDNGTKYPEYCEISDDFEDLAKQKKKGGGLDQWTKV